MVIFYLKCKRAFTLFCAINEPLTFYYNVYKTSRVKFLLSNKKLYAELFMYHYYEGKLVLAVV